MQYRTHQNDVLDLICWRHYQRTDVLIEVLEANPGLCEQPEILPAGIYIELPDITPPSTETVEIWSEQ